MLAIHQSLNRLLLGQEDGLQQRQQQFSATLSSPTLLSYPSLVLLASRNGAKGLQKVILLISAALPTVIISKILVSPLAVESRHLMPLGGNRALLCPSGEIWTDLNGEKWTTKWTTFPEVVSLPSTKIISFFLLLCCCEALNKFLLVWFIA